MKNDKEKNSRQYDLEERTYKFAKNCRDFVKELSKSVSSFEYGKQLIRSSGSVAANYIEANESLSIKDFYHRIKICRKEAKESKLWLNLCDIGDKEVLKDKQDTLIQEAFELTKIFGSIVERNK